MAEHPAQAYVYEVTSVSRVVDGDTVWLYLDVGFRNNLLCHLRVYGCDTPERFKGSAFEKAKAAEAKTFTTDWLLQDGTMWVRTHKDPDNFGRWLGDIWAETGSTTHHLSLDLIEAKLATAWPTRWRQMYDQG